ncbi:MAG: DUF1292 domain-containing protein [Clostridia bacterium]|nr:DUF1292 domain-containing protein [Clostridia bacterium]
MEEERDYVVFTDEDGSEFELDVIDYFDHNDNEYAILIDYNEDESEDGEQAVYIMKIVVSDDGETEEFVPPADEDMDELIAIAEQRLSECCDCGEEGCDCGEEGCNCGCEDK